MSPGTTGRCGGVVFGALMPHGPILIPAVGQEYLKRVASSLAALKVVGERLAARQAEAVVLVSPHSPRRCGAFGFWGGNRLRGTFESFGAPEAEVDLPLAVSLQAEIREQAERVGLPTWEIPAQTLDHGALVPLWHLAQAGWAGPTVILGLNYPGEGGLETLGRAVARAATRLGQQAAVIASGDMSHRLALNAPGGYEPRAREFERQFVALLRSGEYEKLRQLDPDLQELAGEDALDSTRVVAAAIGFQATGHVVLSYEQPFGVGYGVAILFDSTDPTSQNGLVGATEGCQKTWAQTLPRIARQAILTSLFETTGHFPPPEDPCLSKRRAIFVTVHGPQEELRGCAGTLYPQRQTIIDETRQAAQTAAFYDGRFPPISWEDLPRMRLEVTVLDALQEVKSHTELDPAHYGVVVSTADGRAGCLLPGLLQISTVQEQLKVARCKGAIRAEEPVRIQRFTASVFPENQPDQPAEFMFKPKVHSDHPAQWWSPLPDGRLECQLCPRLCKLNEGQRGFCFVRRRLGGQLVLTSYGLSSGFCIDPIEKKPLNHFFPGTSVLSFGTAGCNLGCRFCQNWAISKARESDRLAEAASPEAIAKAARKLGCQAVAFTYNDPVIFAEYAMDIAQACRAGGVATVAVTAGYMNPQPRADFYRHIDAANVDLKGFTESFYHKLCFGQLAPVLETLEYLHRETTVWLEVTSLLIPGENDDEKQLHHAAEWFAEHLGSDTPWHFTAFHPDFKMLDKPPTPLATLQRARTIALSKGLHYVYTGNVDDPTGSGTQCPECGQLLIARRGYEIEAWNLAGGSCRFCGCPIAGHFADQPGTWGGRRMPVHLN